MNRSLLLGLCLWFPLVSIAPAAAADEAQRTDRETVEEYGSRLRDLCSDPLRCQSPPESGKIEALIRPIRSLLDAEIADPDLLQGFPFVDSYETLSQIPSNPCRLTLDLLAEWRNGLAELDAKAYKVNRFSERPAARWVVREARGIPAQPTKKMLSGFIEREQGSVYVSPQGERCTGSRAGCERVRYVLLKCLVPGVHDPREARDRLHAFPPEKANRRVTHYWEVPLEEETLLLRRNYRLKPLPGYEGTMENYHRLAFRDAQRIVILEVNTRTGRFILQTDNAAAYIRSPPHGVTVALLFTGRYAMEGFFRMLVGDKTLTEPLEVLSILRQYVMAPERGVDHAVWAGEQDFRENQAP